MVEISYVNVDSKFKIKKSRFKNQDFRSGLKNWKTMWCGTELLEEEEQQTAGGESGAQKALPPPETETKD